MLHLGLLHLALQRLGLLHLELLHQLLDHLVQVVLLPVLPPLELGLPVLARYLQDKLRHPQTHNQTVLLEPYRYLSAEAQELVLPVLRLYYLRPEL